MSRQFRYLSTLDVLVLSHRLAVHLFPDELDLGEGSKAMARVLNPNALDSALGQPKHSYYPTVVDKAAALLRSIVKDHPFVDGNKRIAMASTWVFMALNRRLLLTSNEEMVSFALALANSQPALPTREVARWLRRYSIALPADSSAIARKVERWLPEHSFDDDLQRVDHMTIAVNEARAIYDAAAGL